MYRAILFICVFYGYTTHIVRDNQKQAMPGVHNKVFIYTFAEPTYDIHVPDFSKNLLSFAASKLQGFLGKVINSKCMACTAQWSKNQWLLAIAVIVWLTIPEAKLKDFTVEWITSILQDSFLNIICK